MNVDEVKTPKAKPKKSIFECTSIRCKNYNCDYCPKCSHAIYRGSATIGGRKYTWEFNPYHGPLFCCRAIGKTDWLPNARHAVWASFEKWHNRHFSNAANEPLWR